MGQHYRHLTEQDRTFLQIMLDKGYTKIKIATILGVHRSTIHLEFKRNSVKYWHRGVAVHPRQSKSSMFSFIQ